MHVLVHPPSWSNDGVKFGGKMSADIGLRGRNAKNGGQHFGREALIENEDPAVNSALLQIVRVFLQCIYRDMIMATFLRSVSKSDSHR